MENLTPGEIVTSRGHNGAKTHQQRDVGIGLITLYHLWFSFLTYANLLWLTCNDSMVKHCEDSVLNTSKMYIFFFLLYINLESWVLSVTGPPCRPHTGDGLRTLTHICRGLPGLVTVGEDAPKSWHTWRPIESGNPVKGGILLKMGWGRNMKRNC